MSKLFFQVIGEVIELPFALIGHVKLEPVTKGWVTRLKGHTDFEGEQGMTQAAIIAIKTSGYIAGYKDEEIELWDVVEIWENETMARVAGIANDQSTAYQIETGKLIWL